MEQRRELSDQPPRKKKKRRPSPGNEDDDEEAAWPPWVLEANSGKRLVPKTFKNPIVPRTSDEAAERGGIRVLKIYNRFARVPPEWKKWPSLEGYERFNVCKNNRYQDLSPMVLGPVYDEKGELYADTIEDGWQCSKVWPAHLQGYDARDERWERNWKEWSKRGRFSGESRRHRTPSSSGSRQQVDARNKNIPLFSYYMGDKMPYKEARKRMYMRWYEDAVKETAAYRDLKARHMSGENLLLVEFDGLDRANDEENRDLTEEMLLRLLDDDSRPFGHGLVLACCLLDLPLWRSSSYQVGVAKRQELAFKALEESFFSSFRCDNRIYQFCRGGPDNARMYHDVTLRREVHEKHAKLGDVIRSVRVSVPDDMEERYYYPVAGHACDVATRSPFLTTTGQLTCSACSGWTCPLPDKLSLFLEFFPVGEDSLILSDDEYEKEYTDYIAEYPDADEFFMVECTASWTLHADQRSEIDDDLDVFIF